MGNNNININKKSHKSFILTVQPVPKLAVFVSLTPRCVYWGVKWIL